MRNNVSKSGCETLVHQRKQMSHSYQLAQIEPFSRFILFNKDYFNPIQLLHN
jgi:hypothetical protein